MAWTCYHYNLWSTTTRRMHRPLAQLARISLILGLRERVNGERLPRRQAVDPPEEELQMSKRGSRVICRYLVPCQVDAYERQAALRVSESHDAHARPRLH